MVPVVFNSYAPFCGRRSTTVLQCVFGRLVRCFAALWLVLGPLPANAQLLGQLAVDLSSQVVSDSVSTSNAKYVPAALVEYRASISNGGLLWLTNNSVVLTNPVPPDMALFVGDLGLSGSGPVMFSEGARPSTLTCDFGGFADGADCLEFSNDGGTTFAYQPQPDASGFDAAVTHIRIRPKGTMAPAFLQPSSFVLRYRMKVN